jgi:catechol 2,3-dioxygenase-like lactoylglutathione lyase family enzyme
MSDKPPFGVNAIDHVVLRTGDQERLIAFYCDVVGLKVERRSKGGLVQLRAGTSQVDVVPADDRDQPGRNMEHFCFRVLPFDEDAIRAHLAAAGVEVVKAGMRYGAEGTGPSVYICDPDGNEVELKGPSDGKLLG